MGRDIRSNAGAKTLDLVRGFIAHITDEHHRVVNTVLREENRLFSDERRETVFRLLVSFRQGIS
ncbi:MAG: hypothetical protein C4294_06150 [Nitrospiraceae bacterium]